VQRHRAAHGGAEEVFEEGARVGGRGGRHVGVSRSDIVPGREEGPESKAGQVAPE
jgi:hypothetical protein